MKTIATFALCFLLVACSNEAPQNAQPSTEQPASQLQAQAYGNCEDRSIYMGCDVRKATANNGAVGNALLVDQRERLSPGVYTVSDEPGRRVWSIVGMGLASATVIEGNDALIVVDTGEDLHNAQEHIAEIRKLSDKPVRAVIYTHWHYSEGTGAYEQAWSDQPLQIWAHESLDDLKSGSVGALGLTMARRAWRHFGVDLPAEGPDALISVGIGNEFIDLRKGTPEQAYRSPTHTMTGDGDEYDIAGVTLKFFNYQADTSDSLIIWLPQRRVAINNHIWNVLPNIYSLRGSPFRKPQQWIAGVDRIRSLRPKALANVHGLPTVGEKEVQAVATQYRDAMQYIYDQTVRRMNQGMHVEDIVESVALPAELRLASVNRPNYGEVSHHVRAIYYGLMGWFSEDAVEINPLPRRDRAQRIVDGFGGVEATQKKSAEALDAREYQWAAELTRWLLLVNPENATAKQQQADALRAMGQATPAGSPRNFYLTQALHREGELNMFQPSINLVNSGRVMAAPAGTYVDALRYAYNPNADDTDMTFGIRFTDLDREYGLVLRNGVVIFSEGMPAAPDLAIEILCPLWAELLVGEVNPLIAIAGDLDITHGNVIGLNSFFDRFDKVERE